MAKTTDLALYGYNHDLPLNWTLAPGVQKAAGTAHLYKGDGVTAPEGVIYRAVTCVEDALATGGLLLVQPQSGRWWFAVGNDLLDAMSWSQVGCEPVVKTGTYVATRADPEYYYEVSGFSRALKTNFDPQSFKLARGTLRPIRQKGNFFAPSQAVYACGIDTGANFGLGARKGTDANYAAYMASTVPFNQTFEAWMSRAKNATIDSAPSDAKQFYEKTYVRVMSAFAERTRIPSSSVATYWRAGMLVPTFPHPETYKLDVGPAVSGKQIMLSEMMWYCLPGGNVFAGNAEYEAFMSKWYSDKPVILIGMSNGVQGKAFATSDSPVLLSSKDQWKNGHLIIQNGAGAWCSEVGAWKGVSFAGRAVTIPTDPNLGLPGRVVTGARAVKSATGLLEGGLAAGSLRDGHVLGRVLIDKLSYRTDADARTAAQYVGDLRADADAIVLEGDIPLTDAALVEYRKFNSSEASSHGRSWMDRGTLVPMYEKFSAAWDKAAEEAARG